jgi:hypothetical protein
MFTVVDFSQILKFLSIIILILDFIFRRLKGVAKLNVWISSFMYSLVNALYVISFFYRS